MNASRPITSIERTLRQRLVASFRRSFEATPSRIVVGFSGGNDSLALALLLAGTRPLLQTNIQLVHVDHRMRSESGEDAETTRTLADVMGLPFEILRAAGEPQMLFPGVGPEEAARRVRYRLLASCADVGDVIAMAHHAGDQAETVLLHLLRGSGTDGLAGMSENSEIRVPWWETDEDKKLATIWRPLLSETKRDLAALVAASSLDPIEDPSNDDLSYRRNEIRHRLMPLLREIEPTIETRLGNLARIVKDEADLLDTLSAEVVVSFNDGTLLPRDAIDRAHPAIARRLIRHWLSTKFGLDPSFERVEAVRRLSKRNTGGAMVQLGENLVAWIDRTHVRVTRQAPESGKHS